MVTQTNNIVLYPNPATSQLTISSTNIITSIAITNLLGQTICIYQYSAEQVQADVSGLAPGLYLVKVNLPGRQEVRTFAKD